MKKYKIIKMTAIILGILAIPNVISFKGVDTLERLGLIDVANAATVVTTVTDSQNVNYTLFNDKTARVASGNYREAGSPNASGDITIPSTVSYNGVEYTVTTVAWYAFNKCASVTSVTLPSTIENIHYGSFVDTGITNMDLTGLSANINFDSFGSSIQSLNVGNCTIVDGSGVYGISNVTGEKYTQVGKYLYSKDLTTIVSVLDDTDETFTTPDTVTNVGVGAFRKSKIKKVILTDNVNSNLEGAFYASAIEDIELGEGIKSIGNKAFYECSNLKSIKGLDGVESIGEKAFYKCTSLNNVVVPASCKTLYSFAFQGCSGLSNLKFEEGLEEMYIGAFQDCTSLNKVILPASLKKTGSYVSSGGSATLYMTFQGCTNLKEVVIQSTSASSITHLVNDIAEGITFVHKSALDTSSTSIWSSSSKRYKTIFYDPTGSKYLGGRIVKAGTDASEYGKSLGYDVWDIAEGTGVIGSVNSNLTLKGNPDYANGNGGQKKVEAPSISLSKTVSTNRENITASIN